MPQHGKSALADRIRSTIRTSATGAIPFSEFMRLALYDPEDGYYAAAREQRIGRSGDFYTSVSVGECFGRLLAAHLVRRQPGLTQIVEQGADDGQLCADILEHLPGEIDYIIIEPCPTLRSAQQKKLGDRARWVAALGEIVGGITGCFICNELLDAFPVHRVRLDADRWCEVWIGADFEEVLRPPTSTPELSAEIEHCLGARQLGDHYTTEIHLATNRWAAGLLTHMRPGARAIVIDYGHEADDYYAAHRTGGTLRGFRDHRQVDDFYDHIGETDLTSSVNFSRLAELTGAPAAIDQQQFLVEAARPWLAEIEASGVAPDRQTQAQLREFQTLIHPAHLGQSFKVLEICRE